MSERRRRHELIRELVATYATSSQGELVERLSQRGVQATQATISRDLEELGIAKTRGADGDVSYTLPEAAGLPQILRQFVSRIDASGNLAVVFTPPGAAGTVANAIDSTPMDGVLATIQGDDTLLVVAREGCSGRAIATALQAIKDNRAPVRQESQ